MLLSTHPNLQACDDFYEALIATHQGLETAQSHALNARLVLLLANHIGDISVLRQALGPVIDEFLSLKHMEWVEYMRHVSDWEINSYLEFF